METHVPVDEKRLMQGNIKFPPAAIRSESSLIQESIALSSGQLIKYLQNFLPRVEGFLILIIRTSNYMHATELSQNFRNSPRIAPFLFSLSPSAVIKLLAMYSRAVIISIPPLLSTRQLITPLDDDHFNPRVSLSFLLQLTHARTHSPIDLLPTFKVMLFSNSFTSTALPQIVYVPQQHQQLNSFPWDWLDLLLLSNKLRRSGKNK